MNMLCRTVGHAAGRIQLDALTFQQHGRCKRCRAELVLTGTGRWLLDQGATLPA
jgi:hypothetical protein